MDQKRHLISATRVKGATIHGPDGERLGKIEDLMIDKISGQITYALVGHDGFLGLNERFAPIPWGALEYDPERHGYATSISRKQLLEGPSVADQEVAEECEWRERVHSYYGITYPIDI